MKRAYVEIPEGQMHYRYAGSGPAVVCLHMSGSSSQEYEKVGEILSEEFTVYALDILGFGGSDAPPRYYTLAEHAQTVASFMDAVGVDKAYLIGNLVGCNIASRFATMYPQRVRGIMFGQYCFDTDYQHFRSRRDLPCFLPIYPKPDGSHLLEMWSRAAKYDEPAEIIDARALCLHQAGILGESLHLALFEECEFEKILPFVKTKTVFVSYGKFAEHYTQEHAAAMTPGSVVENIPDATPYVTRSHPEEFAEVFLKHFADDGGYCQ